MAGRGQTPRGLNVALCGNWGCPALLVTGDEATCAEARELLGERITTVSVKRAGSVRAPLA